MAKDRTEGTLQRVSLIFQAINHLLRIGANPTDETWGTGPSYNWTMSFTQTTKQIISWLGILRKLDDELFNIFESEWNKLDELSQSHSINLETNKIILVLLQLSVKLHQVYCLELRKASLRENNDA